MRSQNLAPQRHQEPRKQVGKSAIRRKSLETREAECSLWPFATRSSGTEDFEPARKEHGTEEELLKMTKKKKRKRNGDSH